MVNKTFFKRSTWELKDALKMSGIVYPNTMFYKECFIHCLNQVTELWEIVGMNSPHTNSHPQSPHFRFEKQIETGQTWCFCTKKKIDWAEATAKAYKWRLWNTGFWLAESIWSQPMALALRFAANPFENFATILLCAFILQNKKKPAEFYKKL